MRIIEPHDPARSANWRRPDGPAPLPPLGPPVVVSPAEWTARREGLLASGAPLGVELAVGDDPRPLVADLPRLAIVAIRFPAAGDGRGLSLARLLRERCGYAGELRATGAIAADQVWFLARCGFDAVELPPGVRAEAARASLDDLPALGATAVERAERILRRRRAP